MQEILKLFLKKFLRVQGQGGRVKSQGSRVKGRWWEEESQYHKAPVRGYRVGDIDDPRMNSGVMA